jgi:RHS repeat-associated protein
MSYTNNKVTTQTDKRSTELGAARVTQFAYGAGQTTVTDPANNVRVDTYNSLGQRTQVEIGTGSEKQVRQFTYDATGGIASVAVVSGSNVVPVASYTRNSNGDVTKAVQRVNATTNRTTTVSYASPGRPSTVTDNAGVTTSFTYDSFGNLTTRCSKVAAVAPSPPNTLACTGTAQSHGGDEAWISYQYDPVHPGDVTTVVDAENKSWTFTYDTAPATNSGLLTAAADPLNNTTTWLYDNVGRLKERKLPRNQANNLKTSFKFDAYGAITEATDENGTVRTWHYNPDGYVDRFTDPVNSANPTVVNLDGADQVKSIQRPNGDIERTTYRGDGRVATQVDAAGAVTSYTYTSTGQLKSETAPGGSCVDATWNLCTAYAYDAWGRLQSRKVGAGATSTTTYAYDDASELTSVNYGDATPDIGSISYDPVGRRVALSQGGYPTQTWSWDTLGRLTSTTDANGETVGYGWDRNSRNTWIAYPGNTGDCATGAGSKCVLRHYDNAGRLDSISDFASPRNVTTIVPDADGNTQAIRYVNATSPVNVDTFTYDAADRLTDVGATKAITYTKGATSLGTVSYNRDGNANLTKEAVTGLPGQANSFYGYDRNQRLACSNDQPITGTCPTSGAAVRTWGYDAAGNMSRVGDSATGTGQKFDPANRLCYSTPGDTSAACTTPPAGATTYGTATNPTDNRGNRTTVTPPNGGTASTLGYDLANRLTTATVPKAATGNGGEYTPVTPARIADSRDGTGFGVTGKLGASTVRTVSIIGPNGVDATGVDAVVVNVTAANSTAAGYFTLYPDQTTAPATSNLNFGTSTISNLAVVKVGANGKIALKKDPGAGQADAIVDIEGFYSTPQGANGGTFTPLNPARLADTRVGRTEGTAVPIGQIAPGAVLEVPICAQVGIPACTDGNTNVAAVTVNLTVPSPTAAGFLTAYPAGEPRPATNNLSFTSGQSLAGLANLKVSTVAGSTGRIAIYNGSTTASVDVIVDVFGWTATGETTGGSDYVTTSPARLYDSRTPYPNHVAAGQTVNIQVAGQTPASGSKLPDNSITAVAVNITAANAQGAGYLTAYPRWATRPTTSNLNYSTALPSVANAAVVKVSDDGWISVYVGNAAVDVIIDISGYYMASRNTWTYRYDATGNRIGKSCTGTGSGCTWTPSTTYTWNQASGLPLLLTEKTSLGGVTHYLYDDAGLPVEQTDNTGATPVFYHRDQLGSTRMITDKTGTVLGTWTYSPNGTTTAAGTGTWNTAGRTPGLGWAGEYRDPETGYINLRARLYDPTTGQFLSRDPINALTRSAYGYVYGNPLNATDPSGLYCVTGVAGHAANGDEICNGTDEVTDNLNPDKNYIAQVWDHEWGTDWGTALAGSANLVWGGYRAYSGVQILLASPGCAALVGPAGFIGCAGYGGYSAVFGTARFARGARQLWRLNEDPDGPDDRCSTGENLKRLARGVLPFGEGDWLDWMGGF